MDHIPDLLYPNSTIRIDADAMLEALRFAFLTGKTSTTMENAFATALSNASVFPGGWKPRFFAEELFVDELLRTAFPVVVEGCQYPVNQSFLKKVLCHPPMDKRVIDYRQDIFRELMRSQPLLASFRDLYQKLQAMVMILNTSRHGFRLEMTKFRVEVLESIVAAVDCMATNFETAKSGLIKLNQAGKALVETQVYGEMKTLLDFGNQMAQTDIRLKVAADGSIRDFKVMAIQEMTENPHFLSFWGRLRGKVKLWTKGHRFRDDELVGKIVDDVFARLEKHLVPFIQLIGHLEFYLAGLGFRQWLTDHGCPSSLAEMTQARDGRVDYYLEALVNPLLVLQNCSPVACDLSFGGPDFQIILTGPNSGGKTKLLQGVAWAQLLAQAGCFVPAASARLEMKSGLFVSMLGREAISQSEGRLGTELLRIKDLFEHCKPRCLILVDELCSGTNPSEGCEIFAMVLKLLANMEPAAIITTHFLEFAQDLHTQAIAGLHFLQVALDEEQEPTYQFKAGVAHTSLAKRTAQRLGVTWTQLSKQVTQPLEEVSPQSSCLSSTVS